MKKLVSLILALMLVLPCAAAFAAVPGEAIGDVLYTDVVAYIDGFPIRSYNIAGETYVVVEDLMEYGFTVSWLPDVGKLVIDPVHTGTPDTYTTTFKPTKNTVPAGTPAMKYLYTQITTWIGDKQITGYNIGGYTCSRMDDIAAVFAETYVWDPSTITLKMTTKTGAAAPVVPARENTVLIADASGRIPAAETAITAFVDDAVKGFRALDPAKLNTNRKAVLEDLESQIGIDPSKYFTDAQIRQLLTMWKSFGDSFSYKILSSKLEGNRAAVTVEITSADMIDAFRAFSAEVKKSSRQYTDEELTTLLFQYLADAKTYLKTNTVTAYLEEYKGGLYFADMEANYTFRNLLTGNFFVVLDAVLSQNIADIKL